MPETTINYSKRYTTKAFDLAQAAMFFRDQVQSFLGDDGSFSGEHEWEDQARVRKRFNELAEWSKQPAFPLVSANARFSSNDSTTKVNLWFDSPASLHLSIDSGESKRAAALELANRFQEKLGLREESEKRERHRLEARYFCATDKDAAWLVKAEQSLRSLMGWESPCFRGELVFQEGPSKTFASVEPLAATFGQNPGRVREVVVRLDASGSLIDVRWNLVSEEAMLYITAASEAEASDWEQKARDFLGLEADAGKGAREGRTRRGFIQSTFNVDWFTNAVRTIQTLVPRIAYVRAELRTLQEPQSPRSFNDIESWRKEVTAEWPRIQETYLWLDAGRRRVRMIIWHRQESVELEVEAPTRANAESMLAQLGQELQVAFAEEELYSKARSSCIFAIGVWQDRAFAETVNEAVTVAIGKSAWVVDAWVQEEGEQSQAVVHAKSVAEYLTLLQTGKRYSEADLRAHGPRGRVLRIYVYENRSRLRLSSSLPQSELDNIADRFKDRLQLKTLKEAQLAPKASGTEGGRNSVLNKAFGVIGVGLVALVLSYAFIKELFPQYSVTIISPLGGKETPAEITGTDFSVEWLVKKEHLFRKVDVEGTRGDIRIIEGGRVTEKPNQGSGEFILPAKPGSSFALKVSIPAHSVSAVVHFNTKTTNALAPATTPK